jgi:hypothetical protein
LVSTTNCNRKIYEATKTIRSQSETLNRDFFTNAEERKAWAELTRQTNKTQWLGKIRNKLSFHYPSKDDWQASSDPDLGNWSNDDIYLSENSVRALYQGSDHLLLSAMLEKMESSSSAESINTLLHSTLGWIKTFCELIDKTLGRFIADRFTDLNDENAKPSPIQVSHVKQIRLPYWYYNDKEIIPTE